MIALLMQHSYLFFSSRKGQGSILLKIILALIFLFVIIALIMVFKDQNDTVTNNGIDILEGFS